MLYSTLGGVWLSGALWLALHFAFSQRSEFGLIRNPLEPECLAVHGAFAFGALVLAGWLSAAHLPAAWRSRRSRVSGTAMVAGVGLLGVSGYLLYYLGGDGSRNVASVAHWGVGLAISAAFAAHLRRTGRARRANRRASGAAAMRLTPDSESVEACTEKRGRRLSVPTAIRSLHGDKEPRIRA